MKSDALLDPVPIRFSKQMKGRVTKVARRFGLKEAEIVRRAVEETLPEWERGNMIIMPRSEEATR